MSRRFFMPMAALGAAFTIALPGSAVSFRPLRLATAIGWQPPEAAASFAGACRRVVNAGSARKPSVRAPAKLPARGGLSAACLAAETTSSAALGGWRWTRR